MIINRSLDEALAALPEPAEMTPADLDRLGGLCAAVADEQRAVALRLRELDALASGRGSASSGARLADLPGGAEAEEVAALEERIGELEGDAAALRRYVAPLGDLLGLAEIESRTHRLT